MSNDNINEKGSHEFHEGGSSQSPKPQALEHTPTMEEMTEHYTKFPNAWSHVRYRFREFLAEFFGTMILILFGDGVVCQVSWQRLSVHPSKIKRLCVFRWYLVRVQRLLPVRKEFVLYSHTCQIIRLIPAFDRTITPSHFAGVSVSPSASGYQVVYLEVI